MLTRHLQRHRGEPDPAFASPPAAVPPRVDANALIPPRDAMRARNLLDRYGIALTRNDRAGLDVARRELKRLGISITRQPGLGSAGTE